jgi:hypothetical protein
VYDRALMDACDPYEGAGAEVLMDVQSRLGAIYGTPDGNLLSSELVATESSHHYGWVS